MPKPPSPNRKQAVLQAAILLFRRDGYTATTVDDICREAGVTKGAFFHYFQSKEALGQACLGEWGRFAAGMEQSAPFQAIKDPVKRLIGCMEFYIATLEDPSMMKSCLAGTTVQEVSETHPALREAAQACFIGGEARFKALLDQACSARRKRLDTTSLASLWLGALQGSLLLYKASRDPDVIRNNLSHVRDYIRMLLAKEKRP